MKSKRWLSVMIVAAWLLGPACRAQQPGSTLPGYSQSTYEQPAFPAPAPLADQGIAPPPPASVPQDSGGLSDWIVYHRDCCEGKQGHIMPFYTELYAESGVVVPVGGATLSRNLITGWSFAGGARALFFNEPMTSAWVVDLHIIETNEYAGKANQSFAVTIFPNGSPVALPAAKIEDFNRISVGLGIGREWFLWKSETNGCQWRVGPDVGGRWGSGRVDFDAEGHLPGVVETVYVDAHSDLEIPCGKIIWNVGLRAEWNYTWSNILQRTSYLQEMTAYFTIGARY
jgi:hypothetical protein